MVRVEDPERSVTGTPTAHGTEYIYSLSVSYETNLSDADVVVVAAESVQS